MGINGLLKFIAPPATWRFPVIVLLGIIVGLIFFIAHIRKATSYLSDDPKACTNCHVMIPEYATWQKGSHGRVTVCNDCHVPNDNIIKRFLFKASDGIRHSYVFTFNLEPQVIVTKELGKQVVQENCIRCHSNHLHPVSLRSITNKAIYDNIEGYCWNCHREVPHGKVHSLSSTPFAKAE